MPIVFIDYTQFYYGMIAKNAVPSVIRGKFVQLKQGNALYLVFSPKELAKYHANIVERFCMDEGIEGQYDPAGTKFIIPDRAWEVLGGGKFERDDGKKTIKLYESSMAYGKFDAGTLREMMATVPDFAGYAIMFE